MRVSRLMPFSRSQNSSTAKKSAFIDSHIAASGEQKSRQNFVSDFRAARCSFSFTFYGRIGESLEWRQDAKASLSVRGASCHHLDAPSIGEIRQGQRPVLISAWANGPGPRRMQTQG